MRAYELAKRALGATMPMLVLAAGAAVADPVGPSLAPYEIVGDGIPEALTDSRRRCPRNGRALVVDRDRGHCLLCHVVSSIGEPFQGTLGPDLSDRRRPLKRGAASAPFGRLDAVESRHGHAGLLPRSRPSPGWQSICRQAGSWCAGDRKRGGLFGHFARRRGERMTTIALASSTRQTRRTFVLGSTAAVVTLISAPAIATPKPWRLLSATLLVMR